MKVLIILSILALVCVSATPIDPERRLINRPTKDMIFRTERSAASYVKGHDYQIKGSQGHRQRPTEPALRKGEYMCGTKICKLQPGQIPKGCDGLCQYPI